MSEFVDKDALQALRRARTAKAPASSKARVASRLAAVVPAFAIPGALAGAQATRTVLEAASSATRTGITAAHALVAAAFVAGGAVGAGLHASLAPAPAPRVVYVDRPFAVPSPPVTTAPPVSASPPVQEAPVPPRVQPPPSPPASPPPAPAQQLDAERRLLDDARGSLAKGDAQGALDDLARHEKLYPAPLLGEERDALRVEALVRAGRAEEARALADAFRKRAPESLFRTVVEEAVREIP